MLETKIGLYRCWWRMLETKIRLYRCWWPMLETKIRLYRCWWRMLETKIRKTLKFWNPWLSINRIAHLYAKQSFLSAIPVRTPPFSLQQDRKEFPELIWQRLRKCFVFFWSHTIPHRLIYHPILTSSCTNKLVLSSLDWNNVHRMRIPCHLRWPELQ